MMETIAIYFSPLASTKILGSIGFGLAYHMALIYTNASGISFGASSGPSDHMTAQTPGYAVHALADMANDRPSAFGVLVSDPENNHPFKIGYPEDYYTQDFTGEAYPSAVVATGPDLSARWRLILQAYTRIGGLHLTYSPLSQNSNSVAGSALRQAGLPIPFSSRTVFAPAEFTELPEATSKDGPP